MLGMELKVYFPWAFGEHKANMFYVNPRRSGRAD